jgi:soluble lytic murein transglycosylase-like protein
VGGGGEPPAGHGEPVRTAYTRAIADAAAKYGLDADLLEAQVLVESGGNTDAFRFEAGFYDRYLRGKPEWSGLVPRRISSSYGLLQVMYPTAREHGFTGEPEFLFVPAVGLEWGAKHLGGLVEWAEGDIIRALAAYNGGKLGNDAPPYRNESYAQRVLLRKLDLT